MCDWRALEAVSSSVAHDADNRDPLVVRTSAILPFEPLANRIGARQ
jgi:hypothetical protein